MGYENVVSVGDCQLVTKSQVRLMLLCLRRAAAIAGDVKSQMERSACVAQGEMAGF